MFLLLRFVSCVLVAAALLPLATAGHGRVLVVVLDGVDRSSLLRHLDQGHMPATRRLLSSATGGGLCGNDYTSRGKYWRALFTGVAVHGDQPEGTDWLWQGAQWQRAGRHAVVVGVPGTGTLNRPGLEVLAGADATRGFIGDSSGTVVSLREAERGRVPWPYSLASKALGRGVRGLSVAQSSPWIRLLEQGEQGREGVFKAYRLARGGVYLSPVYRRFYPHPDGEDESLYIADQASWTGNVVRRPEYYYSHLFELTLEGARHALGLAAGDWDLFVYVDPLLLGTTAVYGPRASEPLDEFTGTILAEAYREVDQRIDLLVQAAGPDSAVVLVGTAWPGSASCDGGFFFVTAGGSGTVAVDVQVLEVAPTLVFLAGRVGYSRPAEPYFGPATAAVVARYRRFGGWTALGRSRGENREASVMDADTMAELGMLTNTATYP
ncbi:MAG: hypothetical protein VCA74_05450 [Deltaproteobacteria bacterium]